MPRQWQFPARADVYYQYAPPTTVGTEGWQPVAPATAQARNRPGRWQFPWAADVYYQYTPPVFVVLFADPVVAPTSATYPAPTPSRHRAAEAGQSWEMLPLFGVGFGGFNIVYPVTGERHRPTAPGWLPDVLRALPQPAPSGGGFEAVTPPSISRRPATPPWIDSPVLQVAAPPVLTPWSYQAEAPDRVLRRPPTATYQETPLNQPPAPPVLPPWAYFAEAPDRARTRPRADGFLDHPLAPVIPLPWGWFAIYPEVKGRRPTDAGAYAETFRSLPQPTAPNGWDTMVPTRPPRIAEAPGWFVWAADIALLGPLGFPACPTFPGRPDEECDFHPRPPRCPDES